MAADSMRRNIVTQKMKCFLGSRKVPKEGEILAEQGLSRYEILEEIGKGGMGTVYRGKDPQTGNAVAIKHLRADLADSSKVERFRREGEIPRRLNHPNIVQLLDTVEANGEHYLIMELMDGGSLRDIATVCKLQGELEQAMELLAVVLNHPAAGQNSLSRRESLKNEAEALRAEIERMLPPDRSNSAWECGRSLELGNVVAGLLMEDQNEWQETLQVSARGSTNHQRN
jgi:Protein kinase domain